MNKTLTINISGIVFHIEEDAYERLNKYLSTIRSYFSTSEGRDEIMGDIESRIAELLQEKISPSKQVVVMNDVEHVIGILGKPEDFAGEGQQQSEEKANTANEESKHYSGKRRLFRDPDEKILGGVCSGIANYFDLDVVWIRIILVALTFLGFSGVLVYIILWVVVPAARTTAEKLQMRGEPVDINHISKSVKDETENVKKKMNEFGKNAGAHGRQAGDRIGDFFHEFFSAIGRVFGRLIGLVLVCIAVFALFVFVMSAFGVTMASGIPTGREIANGIFESASDKYWLYFGILLLIGIPVVMMLYKGTKMLFRVKYSNRWINVSAGVLWVTGIAICTYVGIKTGMSFNEYAESKRTDFISQRKTDTLYLGMNLSDKYNSPDFLLNDDSKTSHITINEGEIKILKEGDKKVFIGMPRVRIVPNHLDSLEIVVVNSSNGGSENEARSRAAAINYNYLVKDSAISFNNYFTLGKDEKWKNQDVEIYVKVPKDKVIYIDPSIKDLIYDVENTTNTDDEKMAGRKWVMTSVGLKCIDCDGLVNEGSIRKEIEEEKQKLKELKEELKKEIKAEFK